MQIQMAETAAALQRMGYSVSMQPGEEGFDLVHVFGVNAGTTRMARLPGPVVVSPILQRPFPGRLRRVASSFRHVLMDRAADLTGAVRLLRRADALIALSSVEAGWLERLGCDSDKIVVIGNAGDHILREPATEVDSVLPDRYYLALGTVEPRKAQLDLLVARSRGVLDLPVVVAGRLADSSYAAECDAICRSSDSVMIGAQQRSCVRWLLEHADALLMFSEQEGVPLVVYEAVALGVPVIFGPNLRQLHEVKGPVAAGQVEDVRRLVEMLQRSPLIPETWDTVAASVASVYARVVGASA